MGRLLAVFNIIAGGASLVGLYITAYTTYNRWVVALLFAITLVFAFYVLFVPGNRIEANVSAKLQRYQSPNGIGTVTKIQDEFAVGGLNWKDIPFPHPFKTPPQVELIKLSGSGSIKHSVGQVTEHKFSVEPHPETRSTIDARYRWIATGTLLTPVKEV